MARLPQPGGDAGNWGDILNEFLSQAHKDNGLLKDNSVTANAIAPGAITKSTIGLGNVNNTSDADKPISIATQAALDTKADTEELGSYAVVRTIARRPVPSEWLTNSGGSPSTTTWIAGQLRLAQVPLPFATAVDVLRSEITTSSTAGPAAIVVYGTDPATGLPDGMPLLASVTLNTSSASVQEGAVSISLPEGLYWFGVVCIPAGVSFRSIGTPIIIPGATGDGSTTIGSGFMSRYASGLSAVPSTCPVTFSPPAGTGTVAIVRARVAS
jgi:hypothetical protein